MDYRSDISAAEQAERPQRLLDQVRHAIRYRTEHAYVAWVRRFVVHHGKHHPRELGTNEVEAFLRDLAVTHEVSASTHQQALSALLVLYREVLDIDLP